MAETVDIQSSMQALEQKMESLGGIMKNVQDDMGEVYMLFSDKDSEYFKNLGDSLHSSLKSSMGEVEQDRRLYEEAMAQNERAMKLSGNDPERGDLDFWEKAFAPMQKTAAQTQAEAITSALKDPSITEQMKSIFGSDTVKAALRGDVDDRTRSEKVMDFLGLGGITGGINWLKDWNVRKEEKATAKDQGEIKRSNKEIERIKAAYKKEAGKKDGGNQEKLEKLNEQFISKLNQIDAAKRRIEERTKDPFAADLIERKDGLFTRKQPNAQMAKDTGGKDTAGDIPQAKKFDIRDKSADTFERAFKEANKEYGVSAVLDTLFVNRKPKETATAQENALRSPVASVRDKVTVPDMQPGVQQGKNEPAGLVAGIQDPKVMVPEAKVDAKEQADIQRKLDTTIRPEFYKKGIEFFDKGLTGELFAASTGGGIESPIGKAGMYAAAAAAVGASLYKMGEAGLLVKDWIKSSSEARENIDRGLAENNKSLKERYDKGWNSARVEADMAENVAAAESAKEDGVLGQLDQAAEGLLGGIFGWKSGKTKAEEKRRLAAAEAKKQKALESRFRREAEASGADSGDADAMTALRAEFDKHGKLGAGSMSQVNAPTAQTPGANTDPSKAETVEEQAKRIEEASYQGMKRAMMDPDVQKQNEENAKQTGKQINERLVGRK